jgi:hypothetical protein
LRERDIQAEIVTARLDGRPVRYTEILRDQIVATAIAQVRPTPIFASLNIGGLEKTCKTLGIGEGQMRSRDGYKVLEMYNRFGYFSIPRSIRKRIPELVRDALKAGGQ